MFGSFGGSSSSHSGGGGVYRIPGGSSNDRFEIRVHDQSGQEVCMPHFDNKPSYPSGNGNSSSGREGRRGGGSGKSGRDHYESKTQEHCANLSGMGITSRGQCNVIEVLLSNWSDNIDSLSLVGTKMVIGLCPFDCVNSDKL